MTDRIELTGIEVRARHGVLAQEQTEDQLFLVDVSIHTDLAPAARSDRLEDTVDYREMADQVHRIVAGESHRLIETVAQRVADMALSRPGVNRVVVTVHKPEAPLSMAFDDVSVTVDRSR